MSDETERDRRLREGMEPVPVAPIDRDGAVRMFIDRMMPPALEKARFTLALDQIIARLVGGGVDGEELWHCRSRFVGPLAGHEGLGIVKDGAVLRYEGIITY